MDNMFYKIKVYTKSSGTLVHEFDCPINAVYKGIYLWGVNTNFYLKIYSIEDNLLRFDTRDTFSI